MPKLKKSEEEQKNIELRAVIAYKRELCGYSIVDVAKLIGVGESTLWRKLRMPLTFNLDDLRRLQKVLHITAEEMTRFI